MILPPIDWRNEFLTRLGIETSATLKWEKSNPDKAFTIENMEVKHFNIAMNGFELDSACAVTMNGQSYIFQAMKRETIYSELYEKPYVLLLGGVRRLSISYSLYSIILCTIVTMRCSPNPITRYKFKRAEILFKNKWLDQTQQLCKLVTGSLR